MKRVKGINFNKDLRADYACSEDDLRPEYKKYYELVDEKYKYVEEE